MKFRLALGICLLIPSLFAQDAGAAPLSTKYYENGKQIPTPPQLPPVYPHKERQRRIGGTAVISFSFDQNGKVLESRVKTSTGNKNLDAAADAAVRQWTITPPTKDGRPQAGESETSITFAP